MNGRKVIVDNLTSNCSLQVQWTLNANVGGKKQSTTVSPVSQYKRGNIWHSLCQDKDVTTPSFLFQIKVEQGTVGRLWLRIEDFKTQKSHNIHIKLYS